MIKNNIAQINDKTKDIIKQIFYAEISETGKNDSIDKKTLCDFNCSVL